jgi:hypothetical protein
MKEIKISKEIALEMRKNGIESLKFIAESNFLELFNREKKWEDFGMVKGYYVNSFCDPAIYDIFDVCNSEKSNRDVNPTIKECEMDTAMCQLRQWRDKANEESIFDWCDWNNYNQTKYVIYRVRNEIVLGKEFTLYQELAFKTEEIMEQFLKDHITLIHTAFGL